MDSTDMMFIRGVLDSVATGGEFDMEGVIQSLEILERELEEAADNGDETPEVPADGVSPEVV